MKPISRWVPDGTVGYVDDPKLLAEAAKLGMADEQIDKEIGTTREQTFVLDEIWDARHQQERIRTAYCGSSQSDHAMCIVISDIHVGDRMRELDDEIVVELMESFATVPLLHQLAVAKAPIDADHGKPYELAAGRHRLEAIRNLGFLRVECIEVDARDSELIEVVENLHRSDLNVMQRAEHIAKYADLKRATKTDAKGVLRHVGAKLRGRPKGGIRATARDLGITEQVARRALQVAALSSQAKEAALAEGLADNGSALLEAAKEPSSDKQVAALQARKTKAKASPRKAKPMVSTSPLKRSPQEVRAAVVDSVNEGISDLNDVELVLVCRPNESRIRVALARLGTEITA